MPPQAGYSAHPVGMATRNLDRIEPQGRMDQRSELHVNQDRVVLRTLYAKGEQTVDHNLLCDCWSFSSGLPSSCQFVQLQIDLGLNLMETCAAWQGKALYGSTKTVVHGSRLPLFPLYAN